MKTEDHWPLPRERSLGHQDVRADAMLSDLFVIRLDEVERFEFAVGCRHVYTLVAIYRRNNRE